MAGLNSKCKLTLTKQCNHDSMLPSTVVVGSFSCSGKAAHDHCDEKHAVATKLLGVVPGTESTMPCCKYTALLQANVMQEQ